MDSGISGLSILVLGGRGFLGTHLVGLLQREDCSVRTFDRASVRTDDRAPVPAGVRFIEGDFSDVDALRDALVGVDLVYHLISTTVPGNSNRDPVSDVDSNLVATLRLLDLMRAAGVRRIVYASSGGTVYGNPATLPVPETHALNPICSYGIVKAAVEHYLRLYSTLHGLTANVLRISNPYGMHQTRIGAQGVIATFANRLVANEQIEIWGDGSVVRDYVYVPDVARALVKAGGRSESGAFNIGSGVGHSVREVLEVLQRTLGRSGKVRFKPHRECDVACTYLDIGRARSELGWEPEYSLESGCADYCNLLMASCRTADTGHGQLHNPRHFTAVAPASRLR